MPSILETRKEGSKLSIKMSVRGGLRGQSILNYVKYKNYYEIKRKFVHV